MGHFAQSFHLRFVENVAVLTWLDEIGRMPDTIRRLLVATQTKKFSYNLAALDYLLSREYGIYICQAYTPRGAQLAEPPSRANGDLVKKMFEKEKVSDERTNAVGKSSLPSRVASASGDKKPARPKLIRDARFASSAALISLGRSNHTIMEVGNIRLNSEDLPK